VGRAEHDNIASWRVLENCDMTYIGEDEVDDYPVRVYEILNPSVSP
jgi:RimJ/RimL family protein N-acetyltransferase